MPTRCWKRGSRLVICRLSRFPSENRTINEIEILSPEQIFSSGFTGGTRTDQCRDSVESYTCQPSVSLETSPDQNPIQWITQGSRGNTPPYGQLVALTNWIHHKMEQLSHISDITCTWDSVAIIAASFFSPALYACSLSRGVFVYVCRVGRRALSAVHIYISLSVSACVNGMSIADGILGQSGSNTNQTFWICFTYYSVCFITTSVCLESPNRHSSK